MIIRNHPFANLLMVALLATNFFLFRWIESRERSKASDAVQGVLRSEYLTANSYALAKSISDLEALGICKCVLLIEQFESPRTFYNTAAYPSCKKVWIPQRLLEHNVELRAINGLKYSLKFQLPTNWQSVVLEIVLCAVIIIGSSYLRRKSRQQEVLEAIAAARLAQAKQVSHDIRSPLSALNFVVANLHELPAEKRALVKSATQRINDIANDILSRARVNLQGSQSLEKPVTKLRSDAALITSIVDSIISEKRILFANRPDVHIEADLRRAYGVYANIQESDLKRVLSNLINNSVEAMPEGGAVTARIFAEAGEAVISIVDNGVGIPEEFLNLLGKQSVTHGKEALSNSGSGLGVYHAYKIVEEANGALEISSTVGYGTRIDIKLPLAPQPTWFLPALEIAPDIALVSLDDDVSVHEAWSQMIRATSRSAQEIRHLKFTDPEAFFIWLQGYNGKYILLIDNDFAGFRETGLDIIRHRNLISRSILVTSSFEDEAVIAQAKELGIRIVPKPCISQVPISLIT